MRFDVYAVDPARKRLTRGGEVVPLTRKAFETLVILLRSAGQVVDKEDLIRQVWPDTFVEENNLNQTISSIRKALGDNAAEPRYIETVARRGYRFIGAMPQQEESRGDLAVLPFRVLGPDRGEDYLGIGLADTLITRLGSIAELTVRPTSAVLRYAGAEGDPLMAGRELGASSVLEGSIRRAGSRVRVTVQLVSVASGAPIWTGKYDEDFTDIFTVEDAISERVAAALARTLSRDEAGLLTRRDTDNAEAYRFYLQGRWFANQLSKEGWEKAWQCFHRAIELDPDYALAYAGLAYNNLQTVELTLSPDEAMPSAEAASRRALAIDPSLAEAWSSLAGVLFWYRWDWPGAERIFRETIERSPRNASVRRLYAYLLSYVNRADEGFELYRQANDLDPFSSEDALFYIPMFYNARDFDALVEGGERMVRENPAFWLPHVLTGRGYEQTGRLDEAARAFREACRVDERVPEALGDLGRALAKAGRRDEAMAVIAELDRRAADAYVSPFLYATIHTGLGDVDAAIAWLEKAFEARSWYMTWLDADPALDPLRGDARFQDLVARVGLWS